MPFTHDKPHCRGLYRRLQRSVGYQSGSDRDGSKRGALQGGVHKLRGSIPGRCGSWPQSFETSLVRRGISEWQDVRNIYTANYRIVRVC